MNNFIFFFFRQKALTVTGSSGVEQAMEWLLAHSDDSEVIPECVSADSTNSTETIQQNDAGASSSSAIESTESTESTAEVKSFKCEDW